ncbi:unnamed protein product [Trichogramma brassicae]|uniref:Uncharacterized protein n=1 Tax=Trichogramma brassicae TaxID=86971 RepID=A0A6H5IDA0_9HYME|nr:unnamed protein product [Trichogramma brassicae]
MGINFSMTIRKDRILYVYKCNNSGHIARKLFFRGTRCRVSTARFRKSTNFERKLNSKMQTNNVNPESERNFNNDLSHSRSSDSASRAREYARLTRTYISRACMHKPRSQQHMQISCDTARPWLYIICTRALYISRRDAHRSFSIPRAMLITEGRKSLKRAPACVYMQQRAAASAAAAAGLNSGCAKSLIK